MTQVKDQVKVVGQYDHAFVVGDGDNPHMLYAQKDWIEVLETSVRNGVTLLDKFRVLKDSAIKVVHNNHNVCYPWLGDAENGVEALLPPGVYSRDEQQEFSPSGLVRRVID